MLGPDFRVDWGLDPLVDAAGSPQIDILVMAMSGTMGILPVLAALERGKRVCLATKEILVSFGDRVVGLARRSGAELLPIDSELAAIHQCLDGAGKNSLRRVILTASGGPFWRSGHPARTTRRQALCHPTWRMGAKITIDSATLMNKGLEVIEAARLFGLKPEQVEAVIHPQSLVHALVEFQDGSFLAQLSKPDMRLPIQYCLTYPERVGSLARPLRVDKVGSLEFHPIDRSKFPCYRLARNALRQGPAATCILNTANQVAVDAFLAGRIAFGAIPRIISGALRGCRAKARGMKHPSVRTLLLLEQRAAAKAHALVQSLSRRKVGT